MIHTNDPSEVRTSTRFQLTGDARIPVRLEWSSENESCGCTAELVDLSAGGARLRLPQSLTLHKGIQVRLHIDDLELDFCCVGDVCWVRPERSGWAMGCAFNSHLPDHVLTKLARGGFLDRRTDARYGISLQAKVREELSASRPQEVTVDNYSSGGFRFNSDQSISVGQRVLLGVRDSEGKEVIIPARALWQVGSDQTFSVGCCFLNGNGFQRFAAIARPKGQPKQRKKKRPMRMSTLNWLALSTTVFVLSQREHFVGALRSLWELFH